MAEVNIGGDPNDRSYRYKRPRLQTKIEGRGNGIKTVLPNMVEVAKALHVDPAYATKFFGIELGAQSKYVADSERSVVNGAHNLADMELLLEKFIDTFILCPSINCRLPEISMKVRSALIRTDCAACGFNGVIAEKHRLTSYIIKDRKEKKNNAKKDSKKDSKKSRKPAASSVTAPASQSNGDSSASNNTEEVVTWQTDTSTEAQNERKRREMASLSSKDGIDAKELQLSAAKMAEASPEEIMRVFMTRKRDMYEIVGELRRLELSRNLDASMKIGVLICSLVDMNNLRTVPQQLKEHMSVLKEFSKTRHDQNIFLANIERLAGVTYPGLLPRMPLLLQSLYEMDILDEEVILEWHAAPVESSWSVDAAVASDLREKALPFVQWLQEAEDSDEDDSANSDS